MQYLKEAQLQLAMLFCSAPCIACPPLSWSSKSMAHPCAAELGIVRNAGLGMCLLLTASVFEVRQGTLTAFAL